MDRAIRLSVAVQSVICPTVQLKLFEAGLVVEIVKLHLVVVC